MPKPLSNKQQRIRKLIALDRMLSQQKRNKQGEAKFNKDQLDAAAEVISQVLKLDHIVKA
jgi:hypothetical protein